MSWQMRVLVVEDNARAAASVARLLDLAGHEVEIAADGVAAVQAINSWAPDVVLLDIGLPRLDGWEVAKQVQQRAAAKRPLLVAVTALGADDDLRRSAAAGIDLHVTKPVDAQELQGLLQRFRSVLAQPEPVACAAGPNL